MELQIDVAIFVWAEVAPMEFGTFCVAGFLAMLGARRALRALRARLDHPGVRRTKTELLRRLGRVLNRNGIRSGGPGDLHNADRDARPTIIALDELLEEVTADCAADRHAECDPAFAEAAVAARTAEMIHDARIAAGLTRAELALRVGVKRCYIADLEGGGKAPTRAELFDIALALGEELAFGKRESDTVPATNSDAIKSIVVTVRHCWLGPESGARVWQSNHETTIRSALPPA